VIIFFVLSGYLVGGSVIKGSTDSFWPRYLLQRLSRLWIVFIPCLVLTLFWNHIGFHTGGAHYLGGGANPPITTAPTQHVDLSWQTFLGNALFLQTIVVPIFGDNGPLWSLANEFWYYILFPLIFFSLKPGRATSLIARICMLIVAAAIILEMPRLMRVGFVVWLFGVGLAATEGDTLQKWASKYGSGVVLICACAFIFHLSRIKLITGTYKDIWLGLGVAGMFPILLRLGSSSGVLSTVAYRLSECSYTIYLAHFPFLSFIWYTIFHSQRFQPSLLAGWYFVIVFAVLLLYSFGVFLLFERHTNDVRRFSERLFRISGRRVAVAVK
jgi:peptidoglycan/LPS O-acetylase OafA/YrhL